MSPSTIQSAAIALSRGRWQVDTAASRVAFLARGMWGLAPVRGRFDGVDGNLDVDDRGNASGELLIQVRTLRTGVNIRDRHLLGADFFDHARHPMLRFRLQGVDLMAGGKATITGELVIRDRVVPLALVGSVRGTADKSAAEVSVAAPLDREAVGMGRSPLGMIRGPVEVDVTVVLRPVSQDGLR
jgi:polyisoprenoid-binding protein YceI